METADPSNHGTPSLEPGPYEPGQGDLTSIPAIGDTGAPAETTGDSRWNIFWREWLRPLAIIGFLMMTFRSAVADWNDVPTGSMKPTIIEGDRIFINKVAYDLKVPFTTWRILDWGDPRWGDIVVLRSPEDGKRLVKRVVGLPGDVVAIRRGRLLVNGQPASYLELAPDIVNQVELREQPSYVFKSENYEGHEHATMFHHASVHDAFGPIEVPKGHYFVMGDNRDNSYDSRRFGPVHHDSIIGRATAVALSVDPDAYFMPRWQRFFSRLQ